MNHIMSLAIFDPGWIAIASRRVRLDLWLVVAIAAAPAPAQALQTTADCLPQEASLPRAKRATSGCPELGLPSFTRGTFQPTLLDPATGGFMARFYKLKDDFTGQRYAGVVRADAQGRFQWSLVATNADLWISELQPHRFAIAQSEDSAANPGVVFGLFSDASGTPTPTFERLLPIRDRERVRATELDSGVVIVALDQTNSVTLIGLGPAGQTLWAKELRGAAIPVIDNTNGPPHEVTLVPMDGNDALLQISASQRLGEDNYSTSVLARLAADGTLRWMRKVQSRLSSLEPNPFGDALRVAPSGDLVLEIGDVASFFSTQTTVVRLSPEGEFKWARQIRGHLLGLGLDFIDQAGTMVLGLSTLNLSGAGDNVYAVLDPLGELRSSVKLELPHGENPNVLAALAGVSEAAGRLYYNAPSAGLIGSSSLSLDEFKWYRYVNQPSGNRSDNLLQLLADDRLFYIAQTSSPRETDFLLLSSNLTALAECDPLAPTPFTTADPALLIQPATPTVEPVVLEVLDLALEPVAGEVTATSLTFTEEALCSTDCLFLLSTSEAQLNAAGGSATVELLVNGIVIDGSQCAWTVQNDSTWLIVSPATGTGAAQVTITAGPNPGPLVRHATLTIGGQTIALSQAAQVQPPGPAAFHLLISQQSAEGYRLVELQPDALLAEQVLTNGFDSDFTSMDTTPEGALFGINGSRLVRIDPETGAIAENLGRVEDATGARVSLHSITFAPDGTLFGYNFLEDVLYRVDTRTAVASRVGEVGEEVYVNCIEFSLDGRLLGAAFDLVEIDPSTGRILTTIGRIGTFDNIQTMTAGPDGYLYGLNRLGKQLYRIDPQTGASEPFGPFGWSLAGIAAIPTADSNPGPAVQIELASLDASGGTFRFDLTGPGGAVVEIESSTDLIQWETLVTRTLGEGPESFTAPPDATAQARFYRLKLQ